MYNVLYIIIKAIFKCESPVCFFRVPLNLENRGALFFFLQMEAIFDLPPFHHALVMSNMDAFFTHFNTLSHYCFLSVQLLGTEYVHC